MTAPKLIRCRCHRRSPEHLQLFRDVKLLFEVAGSRGLHKSHRSDAFIVACTCGAIEKSFTIPTISVRRLLLHIECTDKPHEGSDCYQSRQNKAHQLHIIEAGTSRGNLVTAWRKVSESSSTATRLYTS